jgi:lipooligosaccharide transport system permease protein
MNRPASPLTWRFLRVWLRDWRVNRRSWHISFLTPLLEPLFYVASFGIGFRLLIPEVIYQGKAIPYLDFMAPAIIATNIMYTAFFENTFSSFVRMYYQKTYDAMLATPLSLDEIIVGEIVWGATKSFLAAAIMMTALSAFGLIHYPAGLGILPVAFLGGLGFGALAMIFTGLVKHIDYFNLPIFLVITPMYLFSGTFFPLDALPAWARQVASTLPLTHLVTLTRGLAFGALPALDALQAVAYLLAFAALLLPLAVLAMRRRLIK